jgi:hypothetical protein
MTTRWYGTRFVKHGAPPHRLCRLATDRYRSSRSQTSEGGDMAKKKGKKDKGKKGKKK